MNRLNPLCRKIAGHRENRLVLGTHRRRRSRAPIAGLVVGILRRRRTRDRIHFFLDFARQRRLNWHSERNV